MTAPDLTNERLQAIIEAAGKFEHTPWRCVTDPDEFDESADVVDALNRIVCTTDIRHGMQIALADPATIAAMAGEIVRLRADVERHRSDNGYVIGWNAGWDHAWSEPLKFPTHLRKMWSGGEVQSWLDEQRRIARQALGDTHEPK